MNRQQQRSEETRARILAAAQVAFAEHGYNAASVAQICQAAGVTKGAFYYHYDSKQDLFLALLDEWLDALSGQLELLRVEQATVPQGLVAMTDVVDDVLGIAGPKLPIYMEFLTQAVRDEEVWQATVAPLRQYRGILTGLIEKGIEEGTLRDVAPEDTARVVIALIMGLLLQALLSREGADWEGISREGMHMLLEGLLER